MVQGRPAVSLLPGGNEMVTRASLRGIAAFAVAAVALSGCYLWDEHDGRSSKNRRCTVKWVECTYYACYYRFHCEPQKRVCDDGGGGSTRLDSGTATRRDSGTIRRDSGAGTRDGNTPVADMGTSAPDLGPPPPGCDGTGGCADGFECLAGVCQPCPNGICPCRSDAACGQNERCNLSSGECERITCASLTSEGDCLARGDCLAVYSGQNCTRPDGHECKAGDTDCNCATFDFAVCAERSIP